MIKTKFSPTFWVTLFIAAHCIGWALLPIFTRYNLPLDAIEGTLWGREMQWGYDKNPYLNAWLTNLAVNLDGHQGWLVYVFSQSCVAFSFYAVYQLGKRILNPTCALIAVLLLEGIQYFNFHAIDFNDNTLELGLWSLTIYFFYFAMQKNNERKQPFLDWGLTGLMAGLAMMAKYYTSALLAAMFIFMLSNKERRKTFATLPPYFGLALFLAVTMPHIVWLFSHDFITVKYVFARGSSDAHWSNHFFFPLQFAWQQFEAFLPAFILYLLFFYSKSSSLRKVAWTRFLCPGLLHLDASVYNNPGHKKRVQATFRNDDGFAFLMYVGLGPLLLTLILSLVLGTNLRAGWGMPLLTWSTILLMMYLQPTITKTRLYSFIATIFVLLALMLTGYRLSITHSSTTTSANFPGKEIAKRITTMWHGRYHTPLAYVAGSRWVGGNISFYSSDHPSVFVEWKQDRAAWIDLADLQRNGAVFVWEISANETLPEDVKKAYPRLGKSSIQQFYWQRSSQLEPVKIGIAFLPPKSSEKSP